MAQNTLYWVFYMGSLMVGPIVSGSMALQLGWRSFWWFNTGLIGLSILSVIFMFPETKWHRARPEELVKTDSQERTAAVTVDAEKIAGVTTTTLSPQTTAQRDPWLGKGGPNKKQWGLYTPCANSMKSVLMDLWIPWKLFAFPIVEFSSFVVSWSCSSFLTINLTQSQNFAAPPYNFNSQSIGFMNFAILGGALLGLATAGPLSDWVSARATRKNRGIREPEMRLPSMSMTPPPSHIVRKHPH